MSEDSREKTSNRTLEHPFVPGKELKFESFLPFVKVGDEKLRERFTNLLRILFSETGEIWQPGGCYGTEQIESIARNAKADKKLENTNITAMNWADGHFYLTVKLDGSDQDLIVDPFGVPTPGQNYYHNIRSITPFFGELKLAPPQHQRIYSAAKPIGDRGYHHFHP